MSCLLPVVQARLVRDLGVVVTHRPIARRSQGSCSNNSFAHFTFGGRWPQGTGLSAKRIARRALSP
eukprot:scaffold85494_cov30-Tisochrysis_lutea.AAC.1